MKKNKETLNVFNFKLNKLFIGFSILLSLNNLNSQNISKKTYRFGIGTEAHFTGNEHGTIYNLNGSLYNGKSMFTLGPSIQSRSNAINGGKMSFSYMVTGQDDFLMENDRYYYTERTQLYFFSYMQYLHRAPLSCGAIKMEQQLTEINDNYNVDFSKVRLSTIEACVGFGLNIKLGKQLVWGNYIGLSTFYHTNYSKGMNADKTAVSITLGTSLSLNFK